VFEENTRDLKIVLKNTIKTMITSKPANTLNDDISNSILINL
jgi:hypothetical protein